MKLLRGFSIILLLFNGTAACFGGYSLVHDPSGQSMQMSIAWLNRSPFGNYLIPGLVLLSVIGIGSLAAGLFTVIKSKHYPKFIAFEGCLLTLWILIHIVIMQMIFFLQFIFGGIGLVLIVFGTIRWRRSGRVFDSKTKSLFKNTNGSFNDEPLVF